MRKHMPQHQTIYQCVSVEVSVCKTNNADWVKTESMKLNASPRTPVYFQLVKKFHSMIGKLRHLQKPVTFLYPLLGLVNNIIYLYIEHI